MSQSPYSNQPLPSPGWYVDPMSAQQQRYWDGQSWTAHVRPTDPTQQVAAPTQQSPTNQAAQTGWQPRDDYGYQPGATAVNRFGGKMTPDGVPLAGWWRRGGALIIDALLIMAVTSLFALPFWPDLQMGMQMWLGEAMRAAEAGGPMPDYTDPRFGIMGPYWAIFAINRALDFFYATGLQMSRGGTLGMLALGLRVVPVDHGRAHHGLPMTTAILRNLGYFVLGLIGFVAALNFLVAAVSAKRQTLHDMVGRTQVVRIR